MPEQLIRANEPFRFSTKLLLPELTGLRAPVLSQLLGLIKVVPESCIYYHTHRFLQQQQYVIPEWSNDFAYWISEILREEELGERLGSINIIQFTGIDSLREEIIRTIESYLKDNPLANLKFAREDEEFFFIKSVSFILPTNFIAYDLKEFAECLQKVSISSLYFHIFETRLRFKRETNDFSSWIEKSLGNKELAHGIANIDPYAYALEDLRKAIIKMVEKKIPI